MKFTTKTKEKELLCKKMYIQKEPKFNVNCKLTKLKCLACYDTGESLGYHSFEQDVIRCPSHVANFKKDKKENKTIGYMKKIKKKFKRI